jgi:SpoVK/Ycf46/Vps4 family AAA+-type ATPase
MQSDKYVLTNAFPEKEISAAWEKDQQINGMAFGQGKWVLLTSTKTNYGLQRWATNGNFPAEEIKDGWDNLFDVIFLSYVNDRWVVFQAQNAGYTDQIWRTSSKFPEKEVQKGLDDGYKITSVAYGVDRWAVVMSKGPKMTNQTVSFSSDFPTSTINDGWNEGKDITSLAYGDGTWALVMSANTGFQTQSWATRNNLEASLIKEKAAAGNDISSMFYANGLWAIVFSTFGDYENQTEPGETDSSGATDESANEEEFSAEAMAQFESGKRFTEKGQNDKAIACFRKAIKLEPTYYSAYNSLGVALDETGETDEALECFRTAYKLNPENSTILGNLVSQIVDNEEPLGEIITLVEKAKKGVVKGINTCMGLRNIGLAYKDAGNKETAITYLKKAVKTDPDDNLAKQYLEEAENLSPENKNTTTPDLPKGNEKVEDLLNELNKMTGLENIKSDVDSLLKFIMIEKKRQERGYAVGKTTLHTVFLGPPGTGKTTVARLMGRLFKSMGLLSKGHVVEVDRADLVGEFIGSTALKTTKVINSALGGILFIDEAYSLAPEGAGNDFGTEAINTLVKLLEDHKHDLIVIVAGYSDEMKRFISSNPGLQHRFTRYFYFNDYNSKQLTTIFKSICKEKNFTITKDAEDKVTRYFEFLYNSKNKNFGNARTARNLFEEAVQLQSARLAMSDIDKLTDAEMQTITLDDITASVRDEYEDKKEETLEDIMGELQNMVGLEEIKQNVSTLVNFIKTQQRLKAKGFETDEVSLHSVFFGPPGTGKTTVARLMGRIYKSLGLLPKGHVVEVARAQLVGEYVGQTAPKTDAVIDSALYGILFIDEAYSLTSEKGGNDFGKEAVDTLLKRMDDDRDKLAVIVAGYTGEMQRLIGSNAGLESRFNNYFFFNDYDPAELLEIFKRRVEQRRFRIQPDALNLIRVFFAKCHNEKTESFGNGRMVRNFYEKIIKTHSNRIAQLENLSREELTLFTFEDAEQAIELMSSIMGVGVNSAGSGKPIGFSKK